MSVVQSSISNLLGKARQLFANKKVQNVADSAMRVLAPAYTPIRSGIEMARGFTQPITAKNFSQSFTQAPQYSASRLVGQGFGQLVRDIPAARSFGEQLTPMVQNPILRGLTSAGTRLLSSTEQGGKTAIQGFQKRDPLKVAMGAGRVIAPSIALAGGVPMALGAAGLGSVLSGVGAKIGGQDVASAMGSGAVEGLKTRALTRFTNPLTEKAIKGLSGVASPLVKQFAKMTVGGAFNLTEDELINKFNQVKTTNPERALSFILGAGIAGLDDIVKAKITPLLDKGGRIPKSRMKQAATRVTQALDEYGFKPDPENPRRLLRVDTSKPWESIGDMAKKTRNVFGMEIPEPPKGQAGFVDLNAKLLPEEEQAIKTAKQSIGELKEDQGKTLSETASELYRDWVNKYAPLEEVGKQARARLRVRGAELRPEFDPEYALKRVMGTGSIANYKFDSELKPIIDEATSLNIDKSDLDGYLKARRDLGFAKVGRDIVGSDSELAGKQVTAFEKKYGQQISQVAQKLYDYQSRLLDQLADSGFISKDKLNVIKQQNPDYVPFQRVLDDNLVDEFVGVSKKSIQQGNNPIVKIKGSEKQIYSPLESIIGNTYRYTSAIEKNNFIKKFVAFENDIPELKFDLADKSGPDTISVWVNGQKQYRRVGEEIANAVKGLDQETMGTLEKILSAPATLLRQGATGMNPEFMLPNVIRDQFEAAMNSKYGYVPFLDYFRGLSHLITKDRTGADAIVDSWLQSGGAQEFANISGRKSVQELIDAKEAKKGLFAWLGAGLEKMGRYSELPTRVGLYEKALKATKNPAIAAFESREGTMDFARMGAKMKVANSIIPFLNVQVQGLDKIIRNVKNNPGKSLLLAGAYGVAPQIMTSAYNLAFYPQEYSEIPQYEKDGNLIIVVGRGDDGQVKYLSIPKANSLQLVQNPVENFMSYAAGANPQSFSEMATNLLSSSLPVVGDGSSMGEVGLKTVGNLIPQAIKPLAEVLLNKSFFKYNAQKEEAKEIVPYYLKKLPAGEQAYEWTPALYKRAGEILNVSPLQIQTLAEGYLAGFTKIPNQIIDGLNALSKGERVSPNDVSVMRRFVKETYPTTKSTSQSPAPTNTGLVQKANASGVFGWFAPKEQKLETDSSIIKARISARPDSLRPEEVANYYLREIKLDSLSGYERLVANKKIWSRLSDLDNSDSLSDQQKAGARNILLQKVGIEPKDYEYYQVAKQTNDLKSMYAQEELTKLLTSGADRSQVNDWLINNRKEINGSQVLTPGVIDSLVDQNIISYSDGAALKKLEVTGSGQKRVVKTKAKKAKKIKIPKPKKINFKTSIPKIKKIAAKKFKVKKMKNISIRLKQRKVA